MAIKLKEGKYYQPVYKKLVTTYGSESAVRAEYRRLYNAIHKRITRAEAAGLGGTIQVSEMKKITGIKQIKTEQELARKLARAAYILGEGSADTTDPFGKKVPGKYTLKGLRMSESKALLTAKEHGLLPADIDATWGDISSWFAIAERKYGKEYYLGKDIMDEITERHNTGKSTHDVSAEEIEKALSGIIKKFTGNREI